MSIENSLDGINRKLAETAGYAERFQSAIDSVTKNASNLRSAIAGMAGVSGTTQGVGGKPLGGGARFSSQASGQNNNMMANSLGNFSTTPGTQPRGTSNTGGAGGGNTGSGNTGGGTTGGSSNNGGQSSGKRDLLAGSLAVVGGTANAVWNATPGVSDAVAYQAALFPTAFASAGPYSNRKTGEAIFSGIGKGASGIFDAQSAAALATANGFTMNLNGGSTMNQMLGASGFAYQMTGMNNVAAMQGQVAMYKGTSGVSGRLMKIGMFTADPTSGKPKDMGQIVDELWRRFYGNKKITLEQFDADLAMGFLGSDLAALFGDQPALYEQIVSFMRVKAKAGGRSGMTTNVNGGANYVGNVAKGLGMTEYNSPSVAAGFVNSSRSKQAAQAGASGEINAYVNSAYLLEDFNDALRKTTEALGPVAGMFYNVKGMMQTLGGSEMGGLFSLLTGPMRLLSGFATGGVTGRGTSTSDSVPAMLSRGEYVINARAAQQIGVGNLNALNSMGQSFGSGYASPAKNFASGGWVHPFPGSSVSSGYMDPSRGTHTGIDLNFPGTEDTKHYALAMGAGSVMEVAYNDSVGGQVRLQHAGGYQTRYIHLNYDSIAVKKGQSVSPGQQLGLVGAHGVGRQNTGSLSSGPHLHVEVKKDNALVDPATLISGAPTVDAVVSDKSSSEPNTDGSTGSLGAAESIFRKSATGAESIKSGIGASSYAVSSGTSLSALGRSGGSIGSFTAGYVSATSVANNLKTISILSSSGSRGATATGEKENRVGTARPVSYAGTAADVRSDGKTPSSDYAGKEDLLGVLQRAGFAGEKLREAWAIVMRESRGNAKSHYIAERDDSYGLFQINMLGPLGPEREEKFTKYVRGYNGRKSLFDPDINARAAAYMSQKGRNWGSWVGPQYGDAANYYKDFPGVAKKAGIPGYSAGTPYVSSDQLAYLHQGETVIPAQATPDFRRALFEMMNGGGRGKTVNITLNIEKASDEEAERFARKVKSLLDNDAKMERLRTR